MDPRTLILTVLSTGAAASMKDTASTAVKDAYIGLKALVLRKFEGKPKAQAALAEHEEDPETYEKPLRKALTEAHLDQDQEMLAATQKVVALVQPQQAGMGKHSIQNTGTVQGQTIGDHANVTMHFRQTPKAQSTMMDEAKFSVHNEETAKRQIIGEQITVQQYFHDTRADTAQPSMPQQVWNVPYRRNVFFTGRQDLLKQLHERLLARKVPALTQAISGLGGIGKTQIALEYAYRYRDEYHAILWLRAATRETLISDFVALARLLHLPQQGESDQLKVMAAVKHWLATHDRWLLILDNADDLELACDFLPSGQQGHILLTTRSQASGDTMTLLDVEQMDQQEGTLLLLRCAKRIAVDAPLEQASPQDRGDAQALVTLVEGLPLALDQAGAYIEETGCSLSAYLSLYQDQKQRTTLLRRCGKLSSSHPEPVATTWSLSFGQVEQLNHTAADLLRLCAFLDPDAIPEELLAEAAADLGPTLKPVAADPIQLNEAISVLRNYSLLRRNVDRSMLSVHRLVQAVLLDGMMEKTRHLWAERGVRAVSRLFPEGTYETWTRCQRYLPHAQRCAASIDHYRLSFPQAADLLYCAGRYFYETGQYEPAEQLFQQVLHIKEQAVPPNHPSTATPLHQLARLYQAQGKYEPAERLFQQVLHIQEQALPPNHPDTAGTLNQLARLYRIQGKYELAEQLFQQVLHIQEQALPPNHPDTAGTLNQLARLYQTQGKYEPAERLYRQALHIYEQALPPNHPDTATTLNRLARLYQTQGKYEPAERLYRQALHIYEQALPHTHPDTATTLHNLASLYQTQGKYEPAEQLFQQALHIKEQAVPPNHPSTATPLHQLARLYQAQGKYEPAEQLFQQVLHIYEQALPPNHPDTATTLHNLASLYLTQGKYEPAEPLYQQALHIYEQALPSNHPDTAGTLNQLARLYQVQGKYEPAERLYRQALHIYEQALPPNHPSTATTLNQLAVLYQAQGKYEPAEQLYQQALHIYEQALPHTHPSTATTLHNLAVLYQAQGKYEPAEPLYQQALHIYEQALPPNHPDTAITLENYARLLRTMRREKEAAPLAVRAKAIRSGRYSSRN